MVDGTAFRVGKMIPLRILPITAEETVPLRLAVLRPGLPRETAIFPDDNRAVHFGALAGTEIVAVASLHQENLQGENGLAWRLRGMATAHSAQNQGVGGQLLQACLEYVAARGGEILWCNARSGAAAFYAKHGLVTRGDEFDIPGVGPHFVMWKRL